MTLSSSQINDFIRINYKIMTDEEIGYKVGLSVHTVYKRRLNLKLYYKKSFSQIETIAEVLEWFSNGETCAEIARKIRKNPNVISKIIDTHFFYKKRGYNTITLVLESKINYE